MGNESNLKDRVLEALRKAGQQIMDENKAEESADKAEKKLSDINIAELKDNVIVICQLIRDWCKGNYKQVPWLTLVTVVGAIVYVVAPIDFWEDFLPGGHLDDAMVVKWAVAACAMDITNYKIWKEQQKTRDKADEASKAEPVVDENGVEHVTGSVETTTPDILTDYLDRMVGKEPIRREAEIDRLALICPDDSITDRVQRAAKAVELIS